MSSLETVINPYEILPDTAMSDTPTPRADACLTFWDYKNLCEQLEQELTLIRSTLQSGLDRDADDTTTPHLAVVAAIAIAGLTDQKNKLKAWKESMLSVPPPLQEIARELRLPLGQSIHDRILPAIQKLKAENDGLLERIEAYADKINEIPSHNTSDNQ